MTGAATEAAGGLGSAAQPDPGQQRFPTFDGFRAIAALTVLLHHVSFASGLTGRSWVGDFTGRLDIGVAIFFVISGFLLYRPFAAAHLSDGEAPAALAYLWRRALRIYPAYWVALTAVVYVFDGYHPVGRDGGFDLAGFFLNYGLVHIYAPKYVLGAINQSWTLATELSFYLFLPLYAWVLRRAVGTPQQRLRVELVAPVVLYGISVAWRLFVYYAGFSEGWVGALTRWLPAWLDLFGIGMVLAVVHTWRSQRGSGGPAVMERPWAPAVCWLLAGLSFLVICKGIGLDAVLTEISPPRQMALQALWGVTALFFLLPGIFGPQDQGLIRRTLRSRAAVWLGLVSYGIYLWHGLWIDKVLSWTDQRLLDADFAPLLLSVLALTLVAAALSYYLVEKPALRLKGRIPNRRRPRDGRFAHPAR